MKVLMLMLAKPKIATALGHGNLLFPNFKMSKIQEL